MRMPLHNAFIGVSYDFLSLLPHIGSRVASAILLPLTQVKHKESWNDNEVGLYKDELFDILHMSKGYAHSGKFNAFLRDIYGKAMEVAVDGLQLIESYEIDSSSIYITYSKPAFDRFFQRLGLMDKRTGKTARYFTFLSDDIAKLSLTYSWDIFKDMTLKCKKEDEWTTWTINTRDLKTLTGIIDEQDYIREDESFDRTNFEKKAFTPALKEIADLKSMSISLKDDCYFRKEYLKLGCAKRRNPVKFYEVKFKKTSIKNLKTNNFESEVNEYEENNCYNGEPDFYCYG